MTKRISARYANGVLTPLEPLDLEDGEVVVLSIEAASKPEQKAAKPKFRVVPNHSGFLPGMDDPKRMKQLLDDEDVEHYLRLQERGT